MDDEPGGTTLASWVRRRRVLWSFAFFSVLDTHLEMAEEIVADTTGAEVVLEVPTAESIGIIPRGGVFDDGESEASADASDSKSFPETFRVPSSELDEGATTFCLREGARRRRLCWTFVDSFEGCRTFLFGLVRLDIMVVSDVLNKKMNEVASCE